MISLDQVFLLEQKVEGAVAKIQQLQAENDALRTKVAELTNALSAKSEQLSSFENDQTQIESGIKKALDRLNSIENSVLKAASQMNASGQAASPVQQVQQPVQPQPEPVQVQQPIQPIQTEQPVQQVQPEPIVQQQPAQQIFEETSPSFETMEPSVNPEQPSIFNDEPSFDEPPAEEDTTDGLGFDIF